MQLVSNPKTTVAINGQCGQCGQCSPCGVKQQLKLATPVLASMNCRCSLGIYPVWLTWPDVLSTSLISLWDTSSLINITRCSLHPKSSSSRSVLISPLVTHKSYTHSSALSLSLPLSPATKSESSARKRSGQEIVKCLREVLPRSWLTEHLNN